MPWSASDLQVTRCGVVVLAAFLLVTATGCNSKPTLARLPTAKKYVAPSDEPQRVVGLSYREQAGEAIAPVVVQDDPAPVAAVAATPGQPGGGGTLNGHPQGITRETLNRSIQGAMGALAACFANVTQEPMVAVSFEAEPNGRPSLVRVNGAPPDAERCIRGVMQNVRFPAFEGKGVQVDLPLSFHRVAQPGQPGRPAAGEQPGAPPLFLEP
jgi:hypothetical protein